MKMQATIILSLILISNVLAGLQYTRCGIEYESTFVNWQKSIITGSPIVKPTNELELQNYLLTIKTYNCIARPVGSTHSFGGLVVENGSTDVVGISLANFVASDPSWQLSLEERKNKKYLKASAGLSLLDISAFLRPKDLFLPTQTAGFFFSLAGIMSNSVHGGFYGKGFSNYYVTKLRVMLASGEIRIIDKEKEVKYWRQSFGLFGIILGLEVELEERKNLTMFTHTRNLVTPNFTRDQFNTAVASTRCNGEIYGEFFFNVYNLEMKVVAFKNQDGDKPTSDAGCSWQTLPQPPSPVPGQCVPSSFCTNNQFDPTCRVKGLGFFQFLYNKYQVDFANIKTEGDPLPLFNTGDPLFSQIDPIINDIIANPQNVFTIQYSIIFATLSNVGLDYLTNIATAETNDGYYVKNIPITNLLAYWMPADKLYDAVKIFQDNVNAVLGGFSPISQYTNFHWNQPLEWRFVQLDKKKASKFQIPDYKEDQEWVIVEAANFFFGLDDYKWAFAQLEHDWSMIKGAVPHLGKLYGYDYEKVCRGIKPEPFTKKFVRNIYSDKVKEKFKKYQKKVDPSKLFFGGLGKRFFEDDDDDKDKDKDHKDKDKKDKKDNDDNHRYGRGDDDDDDTIEKRTIKMKKYWNIRDKSSKKSSKDDEKGSKKKDDDDKKHLR